jgi:spore germination cell wall hydrolase CwlJ-like protein
VTIKAAAVRLMPALLLGLTTSCVPAFAKPDGAAAAGSSKTSRARASEAVRLPFQIAALLMGDRRIARTRRGRGAAPFHLVEVAKGSSARALECLTAAVYHEARSEPVEGQRAVAQVVLNRVRHYAYPSSICGVVYQGPMRAGGGCQFTFTCDGSLRNRRDPAAWARAEAVAKAALSGHVEERVGWATHYHTDYVSPGWGRRLVQVATLGAHIFYRIPGSGGEATAFVRRSASKEPVMRASSALHLRKQPGRAASGRLLALRTR